MGHKNRFTFIGDARVRQLYKSFLSQFVIDGKGSDTIDITESSDLSFNDAQLKLHVEFLWRPTVNSMVDDFRGWMASSFLYTYSFTSHF